MSRAVAVPMLLAAGLIVGLGDLARAQSLMGAENGPSAQNEVDCEAKAVEFENDANLTREEKIAKMDQALMKSLSQFDLCQTSEASASAANGGGAGGGSAGGSAGGGGAGGGSAGQGSSGQEGGATSSVASSDMSGTEEAPSQTASAPASGERAGRPAGTSAEGETSTGRDRRQDPAANGKVPDDIPPADNDSILEAQIRAAASNEPDPVIRERLWDEYRKYKGLPTKGRSQ